MTQYTKRPGETIDVTVSFKDHLIQTPSTYYTTAGWPISSELLTGTPTAEELITSDLTIESVEVLTVGRLFAGGLLNANEGVHFRVSGGTTRTAYTIRVTVGTDASPAQTLIEEIRLVIL
jgi:hypothetical protein